MIGESSNQMKLLPPAPANSSLCCLPPNFCMGSSMNRGSNRLVPHGDLVRMNLGSNFSPPHSDMNPTSICWGVGFYANSVWQLVLYLYPEFKSWRERSRATVGWFNCWQVTSLSPTSGSKVSCGMALHCRLWLRWLFPSIEESELNGMHGLQRLLQASTVSLLVGSDQRRTDAMQKRKA